MVFKTLEFYQNVVLLWRSSTSLFNYRSTKGAAYIEHTVHYSIMAYMLIMTVTLSYWSWYGEALRLVWSRILLHWWNSILEMLATILSEIATKLFSCFSKIGHETNPIFANSHCDIPSSESLILANGYVWQNSAIWILKDGVHNTRLEATIKNSVRGTPRRYVDDNTTCPIWSYVLSQSLQANSRMVAYVVRVTINFNKISAFLHSL